MNLPKKKDKRTNLEKEIDALLDAMRDMPVGEEYDLYSKQLERLYRLKSVDKTDRKPIDPNTVLGIGANLLGIGLILKHEELRVITSKAFSHIHRLKI